MMDCLSVQHEQHPHLGGEVSVEDALAVQVVQPAGDVQRQADSHAP